MRRLVLDGWMFGWTASPAAVRIQRPDQHQAAGRDSKKKYKKKKMAETDCTADGKRKTGAEKIKMR
jgi:hypothetical protein